MARTTGHALAGDDGGETAALGAASERAGVAVVALCCDGAHDSVTDRTRRNARTLSTLGNTAPRVQHSRQPLALGDDLDLVVTYDARMAESARPLGLEAASPG